MLLIIVGVIVVCAGVVQLIFKTHDQQEADVKAGGVILIGPIPIVIGNDRTMVILSLAGAALFLIAYCVWRNR
jgi:uncharacterized protein (TIGR00304 family)